MSDYKITGAPEVIWLNYGDIDRDDTHQNCARDGEVTWCEEAVFYSDIKYIRADLVESLRQQLAAMEDKYLVERGMLKLKRAELADSQKQVMLLRDALEYYADTTHDVFPSVARKALAATEPNEEGK